MNTSSVSVVLVLGAWSVAALAGDQAPTVPAPAAAQPAVASPASTPARAVEVSTTSQGHPAVSRLVCLNMSLQCFAVKPKADDASKASIDLKAPDIRSIVPETQLTPIDDSVEVEEQEVRVEGSRPEVYVPPGIASLPWALMHPTQAWRIFTPVPSAK